MTFSSLLAGRLLDGVHRGQRALGEVVVEALARERLVRVDPRDDEHRVSLVHGPPDEGIALPQIEDVVLVDPRRNDEQRPPVHLLRGRRVLDQLEELVLEDHLAGGDRDVLAELEGVLVGHADAQLAAAAPEVVEQVVQALQQVLAAARHRFAQHLRVGQHEVRRRERVYVLPRVEVDLPGGLLVEPRHLAERAVQVLGRDEVGLLDVVERERAAASPRA